MKSVPKALPLLMVFMLSLHLGATVRSSDVARFCCFQFSDQIIPRNLVRTYQFTQSSCSHQAVIFTTKKNRKICVDPKKKWVQAYITFLKAQQQS
ncbi:C-C motif chemokine 26 [Suncus etruscus]|uniref:C-C motif chemokine 26 n=1 Tax=Suncus etruscus TaxID=109475 RepID=UPI00210FE92D|nr:C-C motif chemokine 26 [Suncus etruscus]